MIGQTVGPSSRSRDAVYHGHVHQRLLALLPMTIGKGRIQPGTLILGTLAAAGSMTGCICCILAMGQFASGASIALRWRRPARCCAYCSPDNLQGRDSALGYFGVACQVAGIVLLALPATH